MNNHEKVKEFQTAFNQPVADKPTMLDRGDSDWSQLSLRLASNRLEYICKHMRECGLGSRMMFRASLIQEELIELMRAKTLVDQVDALTDIIYLVVGTAVEMGVKLDPCLAIVHAANMSKLGEDGRPIIDKAGKVRKPEGWEPPESKLAEEIERQTQEASV
jgi:predicted HAD superfamily Cof-like phosphohydrolase